MTLRILLDSLSKLSAPVKWGVLLTVSLILLLTYQTPALAKPKNLTINQEAFLDAYKAIQHNDRRAIAKYKRQLKGYSLYPYVLYHDYRLHFKGTPKSLIKQFIEDNKDNFLGDALYTKWLVHLAKINYWTTFLEVYTPQKNKNTQCYYVQALANRKQLDKALQYAKPIWENTLSLSSACRPIDRLLRNHKKLTGSMVWGKIQLAMSKHKTTLAKRLSRDLSKADRRMFKFWLKVYKKPALVAKSLPSYLSPPIRKQIFTQGIKRLSTKNSKLAKRSLDLFFKRYGLNRDQFKVLDQKIALRSAYQYEPQAKNLLIEVNTNGNKSSETLRWQAQIALKNSDWIGILDVIELMDEDDQNNKQWIYWKARALEATSQVKPANALYNKLAQQRHYYAFLSADRLNKPYQFNPNPVKKVKTASLLKKYSELTRIQELIAIDWALSSKREWYHLLNKVDRNELQAVAVLAGQWEQHAQAIRSLAKAKDWNALHLRFPTPYKRPVMQNAEKNKIDPAWIYGIMRRESAFSEDIKSPVGATGLMQIMPKTAKYISRKISRKNRSYQKLTQAANNIELGSAYLSYLNEKYKGNKVLATASYNAGPTRIDKWIPKNTSLPADQWVDSIPFSETRAYVKAVLEYTTIFKSLLNQKYDRLKDVMPNIGPKLSEDK